MSAVTMKQLLEAGVHFGHQTRRWNPKMKPFLFGARNGIYIIDLQKTVRLFKVAYSAIVDTVANGQSVLFVGTKKQAQDAILEEASRCGQFFVNQRWLGGMLTNFSTIKKSIDRLNTISEWLDKPEQTNYTKKELAGLTRQHDKLMKNLAGIREMRGLPGALFVVDPKKESIAVKEARKLGIPIVAVVDSNCDPDEIDFVIPGNDDAIRAIRLFASKIADACQDGRARYEASLLEKDEDGGGQLEVVTQEIAEAVQEAAPKAPEAPAETPPAPVAQPAPVAAPQPEPVAQPAPVAASEAPAQPVAVQAEAPADAAETKEDAPA